MPLADIEEEKRRRRIRELARRHVHWVRRLLYRRLRLAGWSIITSGCNGSGGRSGWSGPCRIRASVLTLLMAAGSY
jgi:hypothetical protein